MLSHLKFLLLFSTHFLSPNNKGFNCIQNVLRRFHIDYDDDQTYIELKYISIYGILYFFFKSSSYLAVTYIFRFLFLSYRYTSKSRYGYLFFCRFSKIYNNNKKHL